MFKRSLAALLSLFLFTSTPVYDNSVISDTTTINTEDTNSITDITSDVDYGEFETEGESVLESESLESESLESESLSENENIQESEVILDTELESETIVEIESDAELESETIIEIESEVIVESESETVIVEDSTQHEEEANSISPYSNIVENFPSTMSVTDYTVPGINPTGTVINLFDYWQSSQTSPDNTNSNNWENIGINSGHTLKFGAGMGQSPSSSGVSYDTVNNWTQNADVRQGIIKNRLVDGYPALVDSIGGESLSYLFNPNHGNIDGRRVYENVNGLLQVNEKGYYYYDSQSNFAEYNPLTNSFTLYEKWGVYPGGSSPNGQFFSF